MCLQAIRDIVCTWHNMLHPFLMGMIDRWYVALALSGCVGGGKCMFINIFVVTIDKALELIYILIISCEQHNATVFVHYVQ